MSNKVILFSWEAECPEKWCCTEAKERKARNSININLLQKIF
jgi:hypothetical protein